MLKSKKFWSYEVCQNNTIPDEVFGNYKIKNKLSEDALYFYEQIGTGIHPSFKTPPGKELIVPTVMSFQNVLVDGNTLKILFFLLPATKITTLKFSSNLLTLPNLEFLITSILTKPNNIYSVTYEWNDRITIDGIEYSIKDIKTFVDEKIINDMNKSQDLLLSLITTPNKLEAICFRGNFLGDQIAIKIFEGLKENQYLRILNLYKNDLTNECIKSLCDTLLINRKLEELNLGGNLLEDEALNLIKDFVGKFELSPEELEEYNKLAKERQDIINKNNKLKASKKPELEVPFLDEMKEIDGKSYRVRNDSLKVLNLILNKFTGASFDSLLKVMDNSPDLCLTADYKIYEQEQRDVLLDQNGKYFNRIYLLK